MILLDTHVLIWWVAGDRRLPRSLTGEIERRAPALLSPVSLWELTMLVDRGRVAIDRDPRRWARDLLAEDRVQIAELTPSAAIQAARLAGFHGDPADRFIYATARERRVPLATRDGRIREYADSHRDVTVLS